MIGTDTDCKEIWCLGRQTLARYFLNQMFKIKAILINPNVVLTTVEHTNKKFKNFIF